jgi:putative lipoic acid-binding regulatory protein
MASESSSDSLQDVQESLLEFPCKFPIKAMGRADVGFEALVTNIILRNAELYVDEATTTNPSGSGNFISVTVTILATSKPQLDSIYQDLTDCEHVLVAL